MYKAELLRLLDSYQPPDSYEQEMQQNILSFIAKNDCIFGKKNPHGHMTGSAWIVNFDATKALLLHHKKLQKWLQPGGHTEENESILASAFREAKEETGLESLRLIMPEIFDLDIHHIPARPKEDAHLHLDIRFAFYADETEMLQISSESNHIAWFSLREIMQLENNHSLLRMVSKTPRLAKPLF